MFRAPVSSIGRAYDAEIGYPRLNQRQINNDRVIAIVGPTAAGKTALAVRMAGSIAAEVVSADSRQVYRHMDIGTAKPTAKERGTVVHHLIDIVDPDDGFSLGQYVGEARAAIRNVNSRGHTPLLVGGTGQYVTAVLEGWDVPAVPPDPELRRRLQIQLERQGIGSLVDELRRIDSSGLENVDQRNPRRVMRAIERAVAGHPGVNRDSRAAPWFTSKVIGLSADRSILFDMADRRFDDMMASGFLGEVEGLLSAGFSPKLPSMSGIGYSELIDHLLAGTDLVDSVQKSKFRTHRFIRRQAGWFRSDDERIRWFDVRDFDAAVDYAQSWLRQSETS